MKNVENPFASGVYKQTPNPTTKHAQIFPKKKGFFFSAFWLLYFCCMPKHFPSSLFESHISILTLIYSLFPRVLHAPLQCMFATGFSRISSFRTLLSGKNKWKSVLRKKKHKGVKRKYYVCRYVLCCVWDYCGGVYFFWLLLWRQVDNVVVMIILLLKDENENENEDEETAKILNDSKWNG